MVHFGIQVLNFNGLRWLPGLLNSLEEFQGSCKQTVYVVDNSSTDKSLEYVRDSHPRVRIIELDRNFGYGGGYNRSIPIAFEEGCDWVCSKTQTLSLRATGCIQSFRRRSRMKELESCHPFFGNGIRIFRTTIWRGAAKMLFHS